MESIIAEVMAPGALEALGKVIIADVVLAGDNAIIVGALAAGLPRDQQRRVLLIGIGAALVLRIAFALVATQLLDIIGLRVAGGALLLWVAYRMWRETRDARPSTKEHETVKPAKSFAQAAWGVAVADVSMSLDNVLVVAGAAEDHPTIMVFGLVFSVALMGIASGFLARLIERYHWIAYVGIAIILYVAVEMIIKGGTEVVPLIL